VDFAFKERGAEHRDNRLWPRSPPTIPTFGYVSYLKQSRKIPPTNQAKAAHSLGFFAGTSFAITKCSRGKKR
jgi:hypothetical protein